jgi:SH3 domain-containing YSC84-like protein 1
MRRSAIQAVLAAAALVCAVQFAYGDSKGSLAKRINNAKAYLEELTEAPDTAIPQSLMADCRGLVILRQYKAGFVIGVKGGQGIVLMKDEKTKAWSAPAFIKNGEGSFGFQIGGQAIDAIFLIMNKQGVEMLMKTRFKVGVDASAAAGPVGRDAAASVGPGTAILVYSRAKGLYAGAVFEGGFLVSDDDANATFYDRKGITSEDILFGGSVPVPKEAKPLIRKLEEYAVKGK